MVASASYFTNNTFQSNGTGIAINSYAASGQNLSSPPPLENLFSHQNKYQQCDKGVVITNCPSSIFIEDDEFITCNFGINADNSIFSVFNTSFLYCLNGIGLKNKSVLNCIGNTLETTFGFCTVGVNMNNSTALIKNCKFNLTELGISSCGDSDIKAENGLFDNIDFNSSIYFILATSTKLRAENNIINIPNTDGGSGFYIGGGAKSIIGSNIVSVNSVNRLFFASDAGSTFNSIDELQILNNNQFNSNISVYACGKTGIFDNTFNYLESVSAKLSQTRKNLLCNNTFNNKISILFENGCAPSSIGTSHFNNTAGGFITEDGYIATQNHKGNEWITPTSSANNTSLDNTKFFVNPNPSTGGNPTFLPSIILPNGGWFGNQDMVTNSCLRDFSIFMLVNDDDGDVFNGTYTATPLVAWYQKLETFEKLLENPSILNGNPNAQAFYSSCLGTDIEYVVKTKKYLKESQVESTLTPQLEINIGLRSNLLSELHQLHVQLSQNYQEATVLLIQQKNAEVNFLNSEIMQLEASLQSHKASKLALADQYNNYIQGTLNSFVLHEKFINGLAIQRASNPLFILSSTDHASVLVIAGLCPKIYGNAVFLARTFLSTSEILTLGSSNPCSSPILLNANTNSDISSLSLTSTIVDNQLRIEGINHSNEYQFEVISIGGLGTRVRIENDQINLVEIPAGLYYLVVRDQQGSKIFRKFIKI
ncbi:MAG: hypothetical protein IPI30_17995 [Saprospiraceae bacterium]|nr:hypothetical protein [Candidatus Vicinibacter affinis]